MNYEDIVSINVGKRKSEIAITGKRSENHAHLWCICLKLMAIKGRSRLSRNSKITVSTQTSSWIDKILADLKVLYRIAQVMYMTCPLCVCLQHRATMSKTLLRPFNVQAQCLRIVEAFQR